MRGDGMLGWGAGPGMRDALAGILFGRGRGVVKVSGRIISLKPPVTRRRLAFLRGSIDAFAGGRLQIFDELTTLVVGTAQNGGNLGFMRVMRILRLLRIMRLVRILQFVNELRTMVMSVANSMRSLVWTLLLMLLMKYIIGVYLCQIVADTGIENSANLTPDLVEYYGSLPRAVLSLYQAMTGGVDWNDLSKPLETISPVMQLVFALYIAFAAAALSGRANIVWV
ncbi:unnamed protein product [Effrenium voratum]|nr:unnamed protein product [Effrenium voratum]